MIPMLPRSYVTITDEGLGGLKSLIYLRRSTEFLFRKFLQYLGVDVSQLT